MKTSLLVIALATGFALSPASSASWTRAWVASAGVDGSACGPIVTPCRTLSGALTNVAAGAEIDVVDAGDYTSGAGPVLISKSVSIVNDGAGVAAVQAASGANAFTIAAGPSDNVSIRGFTIEGGGVGANGVEFDSGAGLTLVNCVIRRFNQNGVLLAPISGSPKIAISHVIASENASVGISYLPASGSATAAIDIASSATNENTWGISINATNSTGGFQANLAKDIADNNAADGIYAQGAVAATAVVFVDRSQANANGLAGLVNAGQSTVLLSRSVLSQNGVGIDASSATVYSYSDNRINRNGLDIKGNVDATTYVRQ